ncbi:hypothetical protein Hanom_Chr12g01147031 [Helianthus anomalus]
MAVNIINDGDRSPRILLREPTGSTTEVLLYGGQVVSWKNQRREELLFMRSKHGFARNRLWSLDEDPSPLPPANNQSMVDLVLKSTEEDLHTWPYRYVT